MSGNILIKKGLAVAVILLFMGMSVIPSTSTAFRQASMQTSHGSETLYVGGSGSGNYTKIQDAIDNASDGDTVFVYDDSSPYCENIAINKSINLVGENKNTTVIDGNGGGDIVYVSADWVNISGFTIKNGLVDGIKLDSSNNNTITDNSISNNDHMGISVYRSSINTIFDNNISRNNGVGIEIYESSNNNIILCNNISNNDIGIWFGSCICNIVSDNNISTNDKWGIYLSIDSNNTKISSNNIHSNSWYGLRLVSSSNNSISRNSIVNNLLGISLESSSQNNIITKNTIEANIGDGIKFENANNNVIYHNNFINNTQNAHDECNNTWDNGYPSGGNYWDDYNGTDADRDGIGDTPYNISGGSNQDLYPLMYPWYPTHPDIVYIDDEYTVLTPGFGYDCFNRIQYGVNEVKEKGEIYVFNGTYFESVVVDKSISLIGEDKDKTVIDGGGGKDVICVKADFVTITGFTLQNNSMGNSGAIAIRFSDSTKIVGNNIKDNCCGVYIFWSTSNYISDNIISNNGDYGFYLINSHDNNISKNYIIQNSRPMEFSESKRNIIIKNIITDNYGGGVGLQSSYNNTFLKNTFRNNAWNAAFQWFDETIFFHRNIWLFNFWNRPRFFPKPIIGLRMIQKNGKFFFAIPCVAFDWRPAREPYDIDGGDSVSVERNVHCREGVGGYVK